MANASKEIKTLIEAARTRVETGVTEFEHASKAMRDSLTQQNSALVEQLSASALSARARVMSESVQVFRTDAPRWIQLAVNVFSCRQLYLRW